MFATIAAGSGIFSDRCKTMIMDFEASKQATTSPGCPNLMGDERQEG